MYSGSHWKIDRTLIKWQLFWCSFFSSPFVCICKILFWVSTTNSWIRNKSTSRRTAEACRRRFHPFGIRIGRRRFDSRSASSYWTAFEPVGELEPSGAAAARKRKFYNVSNSGARLSIIMQCLEMVIVRGFLICDCWFNINFTNTRAMAFDALSFWCRVLSWWMPRKAEFFDP